MNRLRLHARLVERSALRYTPAGLAVAEAKLAYSGALLEAGVERQLDFEFAAVAVGSVAETLAAVGLGTALDIDGFIAPASKRSQRLRIHITSYQEISGV
ncbi:MAG: primosomal replication protein N [Burkholderiaceae bacterium]|nr:primosomal replication protein N [Burkholderiaceae bacterium]